MSGRNGHSAFLTGAIRKLGQVDPTYFLEVGIGRGEGQAPELRWVKYKPDELLRWNAVRTAIFAASDVILRLDIPADSRLTPQSAWERTLSDELLPNLEFVDAPPETTIGGALYERVMHWIAGRPLAKAAADFGRGNKRFETAEGRTHFRSADLLRHLDQTTRTDRRELWSALEPKGFEAGFAKVVGKAFRTWSVPTDTLRQWIAENREGLDNTPEAAPDDASEIENDEEADPW